MRGWLIGALVGACIALISGCASAPTPGLELAQKHHISAAIAGLAPGAAHPEYTYVPILEWGSAVARCMNDSGYDGYSAANTSFARGTPGLLDDLERRALDECLTAIQIDPVDLNFLSVEQLNYIYSYYQQWLVPCLAAQGIEVLDEPSRSEFLQTVFLDGEFGYASWSPYQGFSQVPLRVFDECPPSPPGYAYALEDWR